MRTSCTLTIMTLVAFLFSFSVPSTAFAKRKDSNENKSGLCMLGGLALALALPFVGDGGAGVGVGGSPEKDSGLQGGGLCLFGDTYLLRRKSLGLTLAGGWIPNAVRTGNILFDSHAMFLGLGCGLKSNRLRFSAGLGYGLAAETSGLILFGGLSWRFKSK